MNEKEFKFQVNDVSGTCFAGEYIAEDGDKYPVAARIKKDNVWEAFNPYLMGDGDFYVVDANPMVAIQKYVELAQSVKKCYGVPWIATAYHR